MGELEVTSRGEPNALPNPTCAQGDDRTVCGVAITLGLAYCFLINPETPLSWQHR
jgi:hypothetical protein